MRTPPVKSVHDVSTHAVHYLLKWHTVARSTLGFVAPTDQIVLNIGFGFRHYSHLFALIRHLLLSHRDDRSKPRNASRGQLSSAAESVTTSSNSHKGEFSVSWTTYGSPRSGSSIRCPASYRYDFDGASRQWDWPGETLHPFQTGEDEGATTPRGMSQPNNPVPEVRPSSKQRR